MRIMKNKNVLLLPAYFEPEMTPTSFLMQDVHDSLMSGGYKLVIHTPMPTRGVSIEIRNQYKNCRYEVLNDGKMVVNRFSLIREGVNPILRALRYFIGCLKQLYRGIKTKDIDIIFISSTPPIQGAMAAVIKIITKKPFIYSLQDIFPDSMVAAKFTRKGSLLWKVGRIIEDFTYKNADKIIVISNDFKRNIIEKGVPEEKIELIYNWVDEKKVLPIEKGENKLFDEFNIDKNKFNIVYAGNLGNAQNIGIIIDAAFRLKDHHNIHIVIFGNTELIDNYKNIVKARSLDNISIFPLQPHEKISQVYSLGDISIVSCKKNFGTIAMPSKTWSIMSSGTPVLASFDCGTELQNLIEENNVGVFTEAENEVQFCDAILALYHDRNLCKIMGQNGRNFVLKNLTKDSATSKYLEVFNSVLNKETTI